MRSAALGWVAILGLAPLSGDAADGVLEINQACATTTGCFPGDAAGLPVNIAPGRSFRLTSDLTPWIPLQEACSTPNPVWCVED